MIMNLVIKVPRNFSLILKILTAGDVQVENVDGDHEISLVNGNITLSSINGSVLANTKYGGIKVDMDAITKDAPLALSNVMGIIELTLPARQKANVKLQTEFAQVQSDFDVELPPAGPNSKKISNKNIAGKINGGGAEILMKSIGGNIYLRKKK